MFFRFGETELFLAERNALKTQVDSDCKEAGIR